jgi:hypothetical protein
MFYGSVCAYLLLLCLAQYLQPVRLLSLSLSVFPPRLFDRRWLLLCLFVGGGVGEREVDGYGDLRIVFLAILQWPLLLYLPRSPSSLSDIHAELSEERLGCRCTSWLRLSTPLAYHLCLFSRCLYFAAVLCLILGPGERFEDLFD